MLDLSATGMRIRTMALIPEETVLEVVLETGGRRIAVRAAVIWSEPPSFDVGELGEMGLQLVEASEEYLQLAAELFADA